MLDHVLARGTVSFQSCPLHLEGIHLNIYMYFAPIVTGILRGCASRNRAAISPCHAVDLNRTPAHTRGSLSARKDGQLAGNITPASDAWKKKHGEGKNKIKGRGRGCCKGAGCRAGEQPLSCGSRGSGAAPVPIRALPSPRSAPPSELEIPAKWEGLEKSKLIPFVPVTALFRKAGLLPKEISKFPYSIPILPRFKLIWGFTQHH